MQHKYRFILSLITASIAGQAIAAANFTIAPKAGTTLPTYIASGGMVSAYYTLTNNTHSARAGYVVKGLPTSVTQVTGSGLCTNPINLAANASCTLQLNINAAVQSDFAICKGSSCTGTSVNSGTSLNIKGTAFPPLIAAGGYQGNSSAPLIATSNDNGNSWLYTLTGNSSIPSFAAKKNLIAPFTPVLLTANCTSTSCIAVGQYPATSSSSSMFIARSTNGGNTWTFPVSSTSPAANQPTPFVSGFFRSQSCNGSVCVASGSYDDGLHFRHMAGNTKLPILANSTNNGVTWAYQIAETENMAQLSNYQGSVNGFLSASCGTTACISVGSYIGSSSDVPMVAASNANGTGWHYTAFENQQLPDNLESGAYLTSLCNGSVCFVGGNYTTSSSSYPVIGRSTDGGVTWTFPISAGSPLPAGANTLEGTFQSISCTGTTCIAAGSYRSSLLSGDQPMIAVSTDNGLTWSYKLDATTPLQGDTMLSGKLLGSSCSNKTCIAMGTYQNPSYAFSSRPLVATSNDAGQTWAYTLNGTLALPNGTMLENAGLGGGQCFDTTCMAAGIYFAGTMTYPLLAQSTNGGKTWAYKIYGLSPALPTPYNGGGYFIGSTISS